MAITLTTPTHVGPGYVVTFSGASGPVPADDYFQVAVQDASSFHLYAGGNVIMHGATSGRVLIGVVQHGTAFTGLDVFLSFGDPCIINWGQFHANGTLVASGSVGSLLWDAVGAASQLLEEILLRGSSLDAAILAAVTQQLPTLP